MPMKILFVDDDREAIEHFIEDLRSDGHTVTRVFTILDARREVDKPDWDFNKPDSELKLLILDVQMRSTRQENRSEEASLNAGLTFYYEFRKRYHDARVIILTNNLHRVPTSLTRDDPFLRAWDKVAVAGRLASEIRRWLHPGSRP